MSIQKTTLAIALTTVLTSLSAYADDALLTACATNPTPATYDPATKKVAIPTLDIPVLDIFTGMPTGDIAQCNGMLQMQPGIEDFKIDKIACTGITDKYNLNSAQYLYFSANTPFANGGTLLICADVPRVITIPPATQIVVAPERYLVTMKQLAVSPDVFHVEKVEKPKTSTTTGTNTTTGTTQGGLPPANDCTNPDVKALVQTQLLETFTLFQAVHPLVVVDYDVSGVWSYPITRSVNPPTGVFTKTFETGATGTYIDGVLKTKTESSTIQDQIAGKRLRFTFNETTRSFSCKNQSGISVAEQIPASCLTGISPSLPGLCDI